MSTSGSWLPPLFIALAACVGAAALEGLAAGRGTREHLAALKSPRGSPPFPVWVAIGILYYLVCGAVVFRLAGTSAATTGWSAAVALLAAVMLANAGWNYVFFRRRDLRGAFFYLVPYGLLVVALALALRAVDRAAAWILLPYLLYLPYAAAWTYRLWRINATRPSS